MSEQQSRDLVLTPGEQCDILDLTKGIVNTCVGHYKAPLSQGDVPIVFDHEKGRFIRTDLDRAIRAFPNAPEGHYIVLMNPAVNEREEHPPEAAANFAIKLHLGHRVNIPGPASFPLWPRQYAKVIPGHHLHSNQYLMVRVYNPKEAMANWAQAVVQLQVVSEVINTEGGDQLSRQGTANAGGEDQQSSPRATVISRPDQLTMGQLLIIRGTDVSFYIPPTGIEVLPENENDDESYVREAVTLEQLEYSILVDEGGRKRYPRGEQVVFPEPTEQFVTRDNMRKFRAIELNSISGIYVKVVAPYVEDGVEHQVEELFITGEQQAIYYPRNEHVIVTYGDDRQVNHAIAIPPGEGRYVLKRLTGEIPTVKGPRMFLPDPRYEVMIRRVLEEKNVRLWFPDNERAVQVNRELMEMSKAMPAGAALTYEHVEAQTALRTRGAVSRERVSESFGGEQFRRGSTYTPPRTITLDTKYDGAVGIDVWTGYAVLVTSRQGRRRVVLGPESLLLEYDEILMPMQLSTGTPKSEQHTVETVYLRVANNRVSDMVRVETNDFCPMDLTLSYRVNFTGDPEKWFAVENYVKFLTDHLRSLLRNAAKQHGIQEFYPNAISTVRDTILGSVEEGGARAGRLFKENGMHVYDVEVLNAEIKDPNIAQLLVRSKHDLVRTQLEVDREEQNLALTTRAEFARRGIADQKSTTQLHAVELQGNLLDREHAYRLATIISQAEQEAENLNRRQQSQSVLTEIALNENVRVVEKAKAQAEAAKQEAQVLLEQMRQETEELVKRAEAIKPDLVAALKAFQDADNIERLAKAVSPLAILGGESVMAVIERLFKGTALEMLAASLTSGSASDRE